MVRAAHLARAREAAAAQRRHRDGRRPAHGAGARRRDHRAWANFYGHLHSRDAMTDARLWPRPQADDLAAAGIVIDAAGPRVADEGLGGIYLSNAIARLPDPLGTTIDLRSGDLGRAARPRPRAAAQSAGARGRRHAASRRHDRGAGGDDRLPPQRCKATVDAIQRGARRRHAAKAHAAAPRDRAQAVADQDRAVLCDADLQPRSPTPWAASWWTATARVLDTADKPIPGLYAAGSTVGGLEWRPALRLRRRADQGHHRAVAAETANRAAVNRVPIPVQRVALLRVRARR